LKSENFESWEGKKIKMVLLQMVPTYQLGRTFNDFISYTNSIQFFSLSTRELDSTYCAFNLYLSASLAGLAIKGLTGGCPIAAAMRSERP